MSTLIIPRLPYSRPRYFPSQKTQPSPLPSFAGRPGENLDGFLYKVQWDILYGHSFSDDHDRTESLSLSLDGDALVWFLDLALRNALVVTEHENRLRAAERAARDKWEAEYELELIGDPSLAQWPAQRRFNPHRGAREDEVLNREQLSLWVRYPFVVAELATFDAFVTALRSAFARGVPRSPTLAEFEAIIGWE